MKIIAIKGGLGNQLFQYAFGRYLSVKTGDVVRIDNGISCHKQDTYRKYTLDKFNITLNLATLGEIKKNKYYFQIIRRIWHGIKSRIFKIHNLGWDEKILTSKIKYFDGYWQSYKYLDPIRDILLKEITLKNPLTEGNLVWKGIINKAENSVSLHVRRGDYVQNPKTNAYHGTCDMEYYKKALEKVAQILNSKNIEIFVFSDDIEWARHNLKFPYQTYFISNPAALDYEEMYLMSLCKHNIIANSTFSWWGAWLNQNPSKIVIGPKQWLKNKTADELDILPKEWIRI